MMVCEDEVDLRRLPEDGQPGEVTLTEQDPLTAHDNEDSNSAFSFDEAVSALIQGISGLYCTEESTEILLGEFARPQDGGLPFHS